MTSQSNAWVDAVQAAAILDLGEHRITQLCRDRILAGTKRKGKWLISIDSLREYEGSRKGKVPIEVECVRRIRGHLLHFISSLGQEMNCYSTALLELRVKPVLDSYSEQQLKRLESSIAGGSKFIQQVWIDISKIDDELRLAGFGSLLTPEQGG